MQDVQNAAPGGRNDPFAPLLGAQIQPGDAEGQPGDAKDSGAGVTLTGVLTVGNQRRALVTTALGTGVICIGAGGRCSSDIPELLPPGWSVLSIDVQRGCIQLALNGQPQDSLCIA